MIKTTLAPGAPWPTAPAKPTKPARGRPRVKPEKVKRETYSTRVLAYVAEHPGCTMQEAGPELHITSNVAISLGFRQVKLGTLESCKEDYKSQARYWVKGKMPRRFRRPENEHLPDKPA